MMALVDSLKQENMKLQTELKGFQSSVKLQLQMLSDVGKHYIEAIEKLKVEYQALKHEVAQKSKQKREPQLAIKPIQSLNECSQLKQSPPTIQSRPLKEEKKEPSGLKKEVQNLQATKTRIKVFLFGPSNSGKLSFVLRLTENFFFEQKIQASVDSKRKTLTQDGKSFDLWFWQEVFYERGRTFAQPRGSGCDVFVAFYDVTDTRSFSELQREMSKLYFSKKEAAILFLLGTKLDLESQRKVTKLEAEEYAKERGAIYFEISAKTEENIWEFQAELIRALLVKHQLSS